MGEWGNQLKQVARRLARTPMFTLVTLITLTAGIGATIAVFSVVEGVLLKPLPYPEADRLVGVWHAAPGLGLETVNMSPANYFIYREQSRSFEDIAIYQNDSYSVTGKGTPERVAALDVTDGLLPILGVRPVLGRSFSRADCGPGGLDIAMLSYGY